MPKPRKDYSSEIGKIYGNSKIISIEWKKQSDRFRPYAVFECKCGKIGSAVIRKLQTGETKGCGCEKGENLKEFTTHNLSKHRLYRIRVGMIQRCNNQKSPSFKRYGGRGIKVCDEWLESFEAFYEWATNNGYEDNLTIERIDNDGNYCPENCTWLTIQDQQKNRDNTGIVESSKKRTKAIYQIDLFTNRVVREFSSIKEAKEITGIKSIDACLRKTYKHAGGYFWEYKNKNKKEGIL